MIEIGLHVVACGMAYFTHSRFGILHTVDCLIVLISFGLELYLAVRDAQHSCLGRQKPADASFLPNVGRRSARRFTLDHSSRLAGDQARFLCRDRPRGLLRLESRGAREGGLAAGTSGASSRSGSLAWREYQPGSGQPEVNMHMQQDHGGYVRGHSTAGVT